MKRYATLFDHLNRKQQGAFVPFVMLGDPGIEESYNIICTLIESGADALELGVPFSDPIADGPTIQKSALRALQHRTTPDDCFELITRIRRRYFDVPIGLLLYSNLVLYKGVPEFYQTAAEAGVDSVLLADVPLRESGIFRSEAARCNIDHIFIAPPNASEQTLREIAKSGSGYLYLLGRAGVTGAEIKANFSLDETLSVLNQYHSAPSLVGFGISEPAQVKHFVSKGAGGAIGGSATVAIVERFLQEPKTMHKNLADFCSAMKAATHPD